MTDQELDGAIAQALKQPDDQGLAALATLRDSVQAARGLLDPALARIWSALVDVARRSPDDAATLLAQAGGRARWFATARGAGHPDTLDAWSDLGDAASFECAWDEAIEAWEAIVTAPLDEPGPEVLALVSRALRGLGARRLAERELDDARALFERDLALRERLHAGAHAQVALSLDNLALALDELGDRGAALGLRKRQRELLVATGASASQVKLVDQRIERLTAP